jgi:hypothetical protein
MPQGEELGGAVCAYLIPPGPSEAILLRVVDFQTSRRNHYPFGGGSQEGRILGGKPSTKERQMSIVSMVKANGGTGEEVFTLDEGRVTINFPASLSSASLEDLRQYLDIFYRKACRLTDDPVDAVDPKEFKKREMVLATDAE